MGHSAWEMQEDEGLSGQKTPVARDPSPGHPHITCSAILSTHPSHILIYSCTFSRELSLIHLPSLHPSIISIYQSINGSIFLHPSLLPSFFPFFLLPSIPEIINLSIRGLIGSLICHSYICLFIYQTLVYSLTPTIHLPKHSYIQP